MSVPPTPRERQSLYRDRQRAAGHKRLTVWIPAETAEQLHTLAQEEGTTLAQTLCAILDAAYYATPRQERIPS